MDPEPVVSVIVPTFKPDVAQLGEALESLRRQSRYVGPDRRLKLAGSLNLGLERSGGRYLARFDADDVCEQRRLELQVAHLEANPATEVLGTGLMLTDDAGRFRAYRTHPTGHRQISRRMHFTGCIARPSVMFRRETVAKHGACDPSHRFSEDLKLWLRYLKRGVRFANLPEPLVRYRQNTSERHAAVWAWNLRARIRHFGLRHLWLRAAGLVGISAWILLPVRVKRALYDFLILTPRVSRAGAGRH